MSLEQAEIDWIEQLAGVKPGAEGVVKRIAETDGVEQLKADLLKQARESLEKQVGVIKLGQDFKVDLLSDFLKRRFTVSTISDDPNDDFDTGHDTQRVAPDGLPPDQFALVMQAQKVISRETQTLQAAVVPGSRKKLFTDREISDAIWEPLKRRKLIPENAIPDRYSEVSRNFAGASAEYDIRLAAFTETVSDNQGVLDKLGVAKDAFEVGGAVVGTVIGSLIAVDSPLVKNPAKVTAILKGVQVGISSSFTTAQTLVKAKDKGSLTDPETINAVVKDVTKAAQALVGAGFSGSDAPTQAIGKAISTGVGMTINVVSVGGKVRKGDYLSIADDLADMVTSSFAVYASNLKAEGRTDSGPSGKTDGLTYGELGTVVGNAIKTAGKALKALKDPSPEAFIAALIELVRAGTYAGADYFASHHTNPAIEAEGTQRDKARLKGEHPSLSPEELNKKVKAFEKTVESDKAYAKNVIEKEWGALREGVNSQFAGADKKIALLMKGNPDDIKQAIKEDPQLKGLAKLVAAQQKQMQEEGLAAFKDELAADDKSFRDMLNRSETAEDEGDIEQIEAMIVQLKRDQMMVDLAFQLAGMPVQAVAAFLPQAGIAVSAIELIKNLHKAARHLKAYREWRENVADARSAMSVQVEAMTNRMGLSEGQMGEAAFKAVEEAIKLVGSAVSVAGPFAPAGHVITATMGAVSTLRGLILKHYRESQLSKAWKLYLSARSNPGDRKLVRESIRKNPTLAKYVIAYGAEVDGNPVARNAMTKCGLNRDVLDSKDANVQKVVAFLEALYPEDPVLMRPLDEPEPWYPGPVEFKAMSYAAFVGAAQAATHPALIASSCEQLVLTFGAWEVDHQAYLDACKDWDSKNTLAGAQDAKPQDVQAATVAMHKLQAALVQVQRSAGSLYGNLRTLEPKAKGTNDKPHDPMRGYHNLLVPICMRLRAKYQREAGALAQMDGAMAEDALAV